jgi:hypothetical protein
MDGAQEVERNRAARAVSAKVDTAMRGRVSFGEPEENPDVPIDAATCGAFVGRFDVRNGLVKA